MLCPLPPIPAIYSRGPAKAHVTYHSVADISLLCPVPGEVTFGCSFFAAGWEVWLPPSGAMGCSSEQIRQHELAHVRGWPKEHPE